MQIYNQDGSKMTQKEWDSCSDDIKIKYFLFSLARNYLNKWENKETKNDKDIKGLRKCVNWFQNTWGDINNYFADRSTDYMSKKDRKTFNTIDYSMSYVLEAKMWEVIMLLRGDREK